MTLQEESRLSYYQKIADISDHKNVVLVQHRETKQIYVRKDLTVYDKRVYQYLMEHPSPFFPQIYECIESDGTLTVIEEYIQGQSLEEYLNEHGTLTEEETFRIVWEICEALKLLHSQTPPLIHRDLKPSNILLDKSGRVRVIDFHAARNFDEDKEGDTVVIGTHRYAAPEQYGYAQTDARTDIYALGVMMNRMLTGNYPSDELCGGKLGPVVRKCIEFDPANRFQSAAELQEALWAALRGDQGRETLQGNQQGETLQGDRRGEASHGETSDNASKCKPIRYPHLPPGFRTLTWWKILLAVIGYALPLYICLTLNVDTVNGTPAAGGILWLNRICAAAIWILWVFFWFNYLDTHRFLPLMKKKRSKWLGYILYTVLIAIVILIILSVVENHL